MGQLGYKHTEEAKQRISAAFKGKPSPKRRASKFIDGIEHFQCSKCGGFFPREGFYVKKGSLLGMVAMCRKCDSATNGTRARNRDDKESTRRSKREHMKRARLADPERFRERERSAKLLHPERTRARELVQRAVKSGALIRPERCSRCNREGKITGHHPDYSKPLDVIWLCHPCHAQEHMPRSGKGG